MEKTYNIELPENIKVSNIRTSVKNFGSLLVTVEYEEKIQTKDGDFVVLGYKNEYGSCYWISIIKNFKVNNNDIFTEDYVNYIIKATGNQEKYLHSLEFDVQTDSAEEVRFATEEEKYELLKELRKNYNKEWNTEKKCLEDMYIPKFGDVVKVICQNYIEYFSIRDYMICIMPNKPLPETDNFFFDIANLNRAGILSNSCAYQAEYQKIVPASVEEKQELFAKLKEANKYWNPEKLKIEEIKWKPKEGDNFYYIGSDGKIHLGIMCDAPHVLDMIKIGNCFKTEADGNIYLNKFKKLLED